MFTRALRWTRVSLRMCSIFRRSRRNVRLMFSRPYTALRHDYMVDGPPISSHLPSPSLLLMELSCLVIKHFFFVMASLLCSSLKKKKRGKFWNDLNSNLNLMTYIESSHLVIDTQPCKWFPFLISLSEHVDNDDALMWLVINQITPPPSQK